MLIIGINYRPELTAVGPYTAGIAEALARRGDRVTVLTGLPHYPAWRIAAGTSRRLFSSTEVDGVRVLRAAHYVPSRQSALRRGAYEGTFLVGGAAALLRAAVLGELERPDAILGVVPSLSGGVLARAVGTGLHVRYGLLFQDLMGRAAAQSGIPGGGSVARTTSTLEAWAAGRATVVGVVSEAFRPTLIEMGVAPSRIRSVPNWARLAEPTLSTAETRRRFGWTDGRQVVLHAGNMGHKQGLEQVIAAARLAAERGEPVRFVLAGGGNQEERSARWAPACRRSTSSGSSPMDSTPASWRPPMCSCSPNGRPSWTCRSLRSSRATSRRAVRSWLPSPPVAPLPGRSSAPGPGSSSRPASRRRSSRP